MMILLMSGFLFSDFSYLLRQLRGVALPRYSYRNSLSIRNQSSLFSMRLYTDDHCALLEKLVCLYDYFMFLCAYIDKWFECHDTKALHSIQFFASELLDIFESAKR